MNPSGFTSTADPLPGDARNCDSSGHVENSFRVKPSDFSRDANATFTSWTSSSWRIVNSEIRDRASNAATLNCGKSERCGREARAAAPDSPTLYDPLVR